MGFPCIRLTYQQHCGVVVPYHRRQFITGNFPDVIIKQIIQYSGNFISTACTLIFISKSRNSVRRQIDISVIFNHIGNVIVRIFIAIGEGLCNITFAVNLNDFCVLIRHIATELNHVTIFKPSCIPNPVVTYFGFMEVGFFSIHRILAKTEIFQITTADYGIAAISIFQNGSDVFIVKSVIEHVMLDDDMKLEALPQTNNIKAIITAELPMDLEKKGQQSYQGDLYVRFIGLGNGVLQSLYDRSVGFFRRQIILSTKEKDPNRKDDPYIAEKMCAEAEGIFLWALEGLHRLIDNDYKFTVSQSAQDNMDAAVSDGNNIIEFLSSEGYIRFKADYEVSSKDLYAVYKLWCDDNALSSLSQKSFCSFLKQNESRYNIEYTNKVNIGGGRYARGFVGIELLQRPFL